MDPHRLSRQKPVMGLLDGLLRLYPRHFRREFSAEIHGVLFTRLGDAAQRSRLAWPGAVLREVTGLIVSIFRECWHDLRKKMSTQPEHMKPGRDYNRLARTSFWLSLTSILSIFLMLVVLFSSLTPFAYFMRSISLPLQLFLVVILLSIPTLASTGSLVTGIQSMVLAKKETQKGSRMAIFGIVFAGLQILSMGLLYWAILTDA